MFTARYGLIPYIQQITFRLLKVNQNHWCKDLRTHQQPGGGMGCNARSTNLDSPTCNSHHSIKDKHADQQPKTCHTLPYPRAALSSRRGWTQLIFSNVCMCMKHVLCSVKQRVTSLQRLCCGPTKDAIFVYVYNNI